MKYVKLPHGGFAFEQLCKMNPDIQKLTLRNRLAVLEKRFVKNKIMSPMFSLTNIEKSASMGATQLQ